MQKIFDGEFILFLALDVENDLALIHHDQTIAVGDGILHVVGDHEGGQTMFMNNLVAELQYLRRGRGVQRRGMFIQQKQLRLL